MFKTISAITVCALLPYLAFADTAPVTDEPASAVETEGFPSDGFAEGIFLNPNPTCPPSVCAGEGTAEISWGAAINSSSSSSLAFTGVNFTPLLDAAFKIGDVTFSNGTIANDSGITAFDFDINVYLGMGDIFATPLQVTAAVGTVNTPNLGASPQADADALSFQSGAMAENFNVFEGSTASAPLYARLTQTADSIELVDGSYAGLTLSLVGFGAPSDDGFVTAVPEIDGASAPFAAFLLAALTVIRRERRASQAG